MFQCLFFTTIYDLMFIYLIISRGCKGKINKFNSYRGDFDN